MGSSDILKGVGLHRANALAIDLDVGDSIALIRSDGEGLIPALADADIAGGGDRAASSGSRLDGVVAVAAAAAAIVAPVRRIAAVAGAALRDGDGQIVIARQTGAAPASEDVAGAGGVLEGKGIRLDGVGVGVALCRAAVQVIGDGVGVCLPHGIERQRLVLRINSIKAVHLFAAVHSRPAYLRIACAGEHLAAQCEGIVIEFDICYRIAVAVFSGLISHIPCARDTHIGLARKLPEDGVEPLFECVAQRGKLFICQRVVLRQIALIHFLHFSGKLRNNSFCGILRRRAREQPHAVAHIQIADILIPQRNGLRIARYGKRAAVYRKIVRCQPVRHGNAAAAILGVLAERQRAVQRQRAIAENGKGVPAHANSVQASDGILSVQRDKERVFTSDILFAQAHRGQVGIFEF